LFLKSCKSLILKSLKYSSGISYSISLKVVFDWKLYQSTFLFKKFLMTLSRSSTIIMASLLSLFIFNCLNNNYSCYIIFFEIPHFNSISSVSISISWDINLIKFFNSSNLFISKRKVLLSCYGTSIFKFIFSNLNILVSSTGQFSKCDSFY